MYRSEIIKSPVVKEAMLKVDRGHYSPHEPYRDSPQLIGSNVTISAPHMHAHCLGKAQWWMGTVRPFSAVLTDNGYVINRIFDRISGYRKSRMSDQICS